MEWRASNNLKISLDVLYRPQLAVDMRAQTTSSDSLPYLYPLTEPLKLRASSCVQYT